MNAQVAALTHVASNHNLCQNKMQLSRHTVIVDHENKSSNELSGSLTFRIDSSDVKSSPINDMKTLNKVTIHDMSSDVSVTNSNSNSNRTSTGTKYISQAKDGATFLNTCSKNANDNDVQNKTKSNIINDNLIMIISFILFLITATVLIIIIYIFIKGTDIDIMTAADTNCNKMAGFWDHVDAQKNNEDIETGLSQSLFANNLAQTKLVYPNTNDTSLIAVYDETNTSQGLQKYKLTYMAYFDKHLMRPVVTFYKYYNSHGYQKPANKCVIPELKQTQYFTNVIKPIKESNISLFQRADKMKLIPNSGDDHCFWPQDNYIMQTKLGSRCSVGHLSPHRDICSRSADTFLNWVTQSSYMNKKWNLHVEKFLYQEITYYRKYNPIWVASGSAVSQHRKQPYMNCSIDSSGNGNVLCVAAPVEVIWKIVCHDKIGSWVMWHVTGNDTNIHNDHPQEFVAWLKKKQITVFEGWQNKTDWFGKLGLDTILIQSRHDHDQARKCFQTSKFKNSSDVNQFILWTEMFEGYELWRKHRYNDDLTVENALKSLSINTTIV